MNQHDVIETSWGFLNGVRRRDLAFDRLLVELSSLGDPILFGGAIRDMLIHGFAACPRDYDFVVDEADSSGIEWIIRRLNLPYRRNKFGGFKVLMANFAVDVWSLESTWAYREHYMQPNFLNLPATVFLNVDAVAFSLKRKTLLDDGFLQALDRCVLDIVLEDNPFPSLNIVRTLVLQQQLGFSLSNRLHTYLINWFNQQKGPERVIRTIERKRYGRTIIPTRVLKSTLDPHSSYEANYYPRQPRFYWGLAEI